MTEINTDIAKKRVTVQMGNVRFVINVKEEERELQINKVEGESHQLNIKPIAQNSLTIK